MKSSVNLAELARLVRYYILESTTAAGSGHVTSSLSAVELMVGLMFSGHFHYNPDHPDHLGNDHLIFSKGHAAPLFYALWAAAGEVKAKNLLTLREFGSPLEGHPTMQFPFTDAATGSLGQGLSVGVGLALAAKYLLKTPSYSFVLLGDSEMAEGSVWEAMQLAAHYKLSNLTGIIDVNRLGQRGETMYGYKVKEYEKRAKAFGWDTVVINGHSLGEVQKAYHWARVETTKPTMVIARTVKGKGVSWLENKEGYHGKALTSEEFVRATQEQAPIDLKIRGRLASAYKITPIYSRRSRVITKINTKAVSPREAYGQALVRLANKYPAMVALDAEVSNSTYAENFKLAFPKRFFEMYIAEQNMVGTAVGLSRAGFRPCVSTFAAFFTRAFDQIRMAAYSGSNIIFVGSHPGVAIGQDGASQMGLEDLSLFRSVHNSSVLYPADTVATHNLVDQALQHSGIVYLRVGRAMAPSLYSAQEKFFIGGSKTLRSSAKDFATIVAAGVTLFEALKAYEELAQAGISVRVVDLYSVKPLDTQTLMRAASETRVILTVEDHVAEGGLGEAVAAALAPYGTPVYNLAVRLMPQSGQPAQLLDYEGISAKSIVVAVQKLLA